MKRDRGGSKSDSDLRKQAEEELKLQALILNTMAEGVYLIRASDGIIVFTNHRFEQMFGYNSGELIGKHVSIVNAPDEKSPEEKAGEIIQSLREKGSWNGEIQNVKKDGTRFWSYASTVTFTHPRYGEVWVNAHEDVTERKRIMEALKESEERYRTLFTVSMDAVLLTHPDGHILAANDSACRMFGRSEEELKRIGRSGVVDASDPRLAAALEERRRTGKFRGELILLRNDGTKFIGEISSAVFRGRDGQSYTSMVIRDITERKRAEEALKENIRLNKILLDNFPCVALLLRPYTREIVASNEAGVKVGAVPGACCFSTWGQREEPCPWCLAPTLWTTGQAQHLEFEAGGIVWDAHWIPVDDNLFMHYAFNITERKRVEESLRESEENMRYIVKHDPNSIAVYDLNLHYIAVSDRYLQEYNIKEANILGKHHYEVFPEMPQRWKDVHQRCLSGAIERNDDDYFERPDGSITYNRWECRPWYRADGEIGGMITYTEVTTERKKAENALRDSEEKHRLLLENAGMGIGYWDLSGRVLLLNNKAADALRGNPGDFIGKSMTELFGKEVAEKFFVRIKKIAATLKSGEFQDRVMLPSGEHWFISSYSPVLDSHNECIGVQIISNDITEHVRIEEELRKSHDELHNLTSYIQSLREEERKRVAHEIHDNLGQALTALKIDISLLNEDIPEENELLKIKIKPILELVDNTLAAVKKISSEIRPDILDHLGLAEAIRWYVSEFGKRTRIKCRLSLSHEIIELELKTSENIYRIVQESLTNIIRHAKATEVKVSLRKKKTALELRIKDNGIGIKESVIKSSESFGLIGIRERARFCGGGFEIDGLPNKGTTITVTIPLAEKKNDDKSNYRR